MKTWMKKANDFKIAKFQPVGVVLLLLHFLPISVMLLKSVAYKKGTCRIVGSQDDNDFRQ